MSIHISVIRTEIIGMKKGNAAVKVMKLKKNTVLLNFKLYIFPGSSYWKGPGNERVSNNEHA